MQAKAHVRIDAHAPISSWNGLYLRKIEKFFYSMRNVFPRLSQGTFKFLEVLLILYLAPV